MKILLMPLGNIRTYKNSVVYKLEQSNNYDFLPNLLINEFNIDKVMIFVLDTLYPNLTDEQPKSYNEMENFLIKKYSEYFSSHSEFENFEVKVVPGVGTFRNRKDMEYRFKGTITDLYYLNLYYFYNLFKDLNINDDLEVYLDITFGINYHTNMLYSSLIDLLQLISFIKPVKFVVTNSESPFSREEKNILFVHKIEEKRIIPFLNIKDFQGEKIFGFSSFVDNQEKRIIGKNRLNDFYRELKKSEVINESRIFLKSIYYGFPLVFSLMLKKVDFDEIILKGIEIYKDVLDIENGVDKKIVKRKLAITPSFKGIIFSSIFSKLFVKLFDEYDEKIHLKDEYPIDYLESISNFVWKINEEGNYINVFSALSIKKELSDIKNYAKGLPEGEIIYTKSKDNENKQSKQIYSKIYSSEKRNFLAHAGLSNRTFKIKKTKNDILIIPQMKNILGNFKDI
ncbi:hypothetical protein XJ44_00590 [Thermosipho affectus]|uniref:TIGR01897 family CRISPR-associated protein n=1 Tax=Thermosipho affectus TaxID=660294 RepID=A0ABX3ILP9_9BACT|nr:CRISPR-associated CARF protein Csx1 [Thermosipho affectus]ONN28076.1 hypothetical protein XJ44_00590 [Thermosipho affectus]